MERRAWHRSVWQTSRLYAAVEAALRLVKRGELDRAEAALVRVEGIVLQALMDVRAARRETL